MEEEYPDGEAQGCDSPAQGVPPKREGECLDDLPGSPNTRPSYRAPGSI